jgi:hypothetical protein
MLAVPSVLSALHVVVPTGKCGKKLPLHSTAWQLGVDEQQGRVNNPLRGSSMIQILYHKAASLWVTRVLTHIPVHAL